MPESERLKPDEHSKSKRKREMDDLQKIGESLIKLTASQLKQIELPDTLRSAIHEAKSLSAHGAIRRQLQYIGRLMREVDAEPIKLALQRIRSSHHQHAAQFHQVEEWRTKLIAGGDEALGVFITEHPKTDKQQLRQLVRKAQLDQKTEKNTGAEKALFNYLRGILGATS
ncbi:MAG: hypothetical protein A3F14_07120 [Gammaproteobacteria bacterium RIFCSPHIGHO2_12_FULL_43_28]|nr:MAG: hypothetical protein A3F14_07120 [Gammaproteobacteria bacterium RIFCSPHIGHO2_12_FULL_43_28]